MKRRVLSILSLMLVVAGILLTGCDKKGEGQAELTPLDFTVVSYDDIPKEFLAEIDKSKSEDFRLTYQSGGWLYIARGYGMQQSGGYSIKVTEVSMADNALYFNSELIGPKQGEAVNKLATYPYIVVKVEDSGQSVVFR